MGSNSSLPGEARGVHGGPAAAPVAAPDGGDTGRPGGRWDSRLDRRLAAGWALLLALGMAWGLGGYPLLEPDEGRNAEVAREMTASGDYAVPHLDGVPYLDKPVLFFALDAVSLKLLGRSEVAARLPSLLFALATAGLAGWFGRRLFGREGGWIAGLAAAAAPLPLAYARTVIFDSTLSFFALLAFCAFYCAIEARVNRAPDTEERAATRAPDLNARAVTRAGAVLPWTLLAWGAMALGVLTKGPVALALGLLVAAPYAAWRRASRAVWHPLGPVLLLALVVPWVAAVSRQVPDFLRYALLSETWQRLTTDKFERGGPIWYYVPSLLVGALPWSLVVLGGWIASRRRRRSGSAPASGSEATQWGSGAGQVRAHEQVPAQAPPSGIGQARPAHSPGTEPVSDGPRGPRGKGGWRRADPRLVYLVLWIVIPFVLFSLSRSKRPHYILPLVPAVALLTAWLWLRPSSARVRRPTAGELPPASCSIATSDVSHAERRDVSAETWEPSARHEAPLSSALPSSLLPLPGVRTAAAGWLVFGAALLGACAWMGFSSRPLPLAAPLLPATCAALGAVVLPSGLLGLWRRVASRMDLALIVLGLPLAAFPAVASPLLAELGHSLSARDLAAAITSRLGPGSEVIGVHAYPLSLPFYLDRTMLVVSGRGRELTSNYVIDEFARVLAAPGTPLRTNAWLDRELAACTVPSIFIAHADQPTEVARLAASLPALAANRRYIAYGPCRPHG